MRKLHMYDVVILLPGILGSVLTDEKGHVWAPSSGAIWNALTRDRGLAERLTLKSDMGEDFDDAGDGLKADRLMWDAHFIPGFVKIDGYTTTARLIRDEFDVTEGTIPVSHPANFYQMPYDWRRDNRYNAHRLRRLIEKALSTWREFSGERDAKVILIAHSMGGLISRYYLETLEGWRDCRALITFGTPYRGSLNSLSYLANGYKKLFLDLTGAMRSMPSAYQLLPIYPVVNAGGTFGRVAETSGIPGIDPAMAEDALRFHREIEDAVTEHRKDVSYLTSGYKILPFVGVCQPTLQSARLDAGQLVPSFELPQGIDPWYCDGDGTVPQVSAVPIEISTDYRDTFLAERHGSLQNNRDVLAALQFRLAQMQSSRGAPVRGPETGEDKIALSVGLDDMYLPGEPVEVRVLIQAMGPQGTNRRTNAQGTVELVEATITPLEGGAEQAVLHRELQLNSSDEWTLVEPELAPGLYRLEVKAHTSSSRQTPEPVHDLFAVAVEGG